MTQINLYVSTLAVEMKDNTMLLLMRSAVCTARASSNLLKTASNDSQYSGLHSLYLSVCIWSWIHGVVYFYLSFSLRGFTLLQSKWGNVQLGHWKYLPKRTKYSHSLCYQRGVSLAFQCFHLDHLQTCCIVFCFVKITLSFVDSVNPRDIWSPDIVPACPPN